MVDRGFESLQQGLLQNRVLKQRDKLAEQALTQRATNSEELNAYRQALIDQRMSEQATKIDPTTPDNKKKLAETDAAEALADKRKTPRKATFKWKSGGVEHTAFGADEAMPMIKQFPADAEKGQHALTITGTTKSGAKVEQTIYATPEQMQSPESKTEFLEQVRDFQDSYGIVPESSTSTSTETGKVDPASGKELPPVTTTRTTTKGTIGDSGLPDLSGAPVSAAPAPSSKPMAKPTPKDVAYLAAHPEMKAKFEARFGPGSANQYLP